MATIDKLVFKTAIDTSGWAAGMRTADSMVNDLYKTAGARLQSIPAPATVGEIKPPEGIDKIENLGRDIAGALLPIAAQIKTVIGTAVQPLTQFAARFSAQFDKVGGAMIGISERIDEHLKFPKFIERVEALRGFIRTKFGLIKGDVADAVATVGAASPRTDNLVVPFDNAAKRVAKALAPIPGAAEYELERAVHVDHAAAFPQFFKSLDDAKSAAIDKYKAIADAAEAFKTGKGSRKAKWGRQAAAADLASVHAQAGRPDPVTEATKAPRDPFAGLKSFAASAQSTLGKTAQMGAKAADVAIGGWLKFEQVKHVLGSLGSVAEKTIGQVSKIKPPNFKFDMSTTINNVGSVGTLAGAAMAPVQKLTGSVMSLGQQVATAFGVFGLAFAAVDFLKTGVKNASDLNETLSKTEAVAGAAFPKIGQFADSMASKFGMVKGQTLDAATGFAGLGKGLAGLEGDKLADFSIQFTKLSGDLSSFANMDFDEASRALKTVLSGEQSDALKAMGVIINETTTKEYALAHGIAKAGEELNEQQKLMARAGQLTAGLRDAAGDLEKTQGGAANQMRKLTGSITNIGVAIGTALLPILQRGANVVNQFVGIFSKGFGAAKPSIEAFAGVVETAVGKVGQLIEAVMPQIESYGQTVLQGFKDLGGYLFNLLPTFDQTVDGLKAFYGTAEMGIANLIGGLKSLPEMFGMAFGAEATGGLQSFGGALKAGILDTIDLIGFSIRNAGDIIGMVVATTASNITFLIDTIALIPTNLGKIAEYVGGNWFDLMTAPFLSLGKLIGSLASTLWKFLTNPTGGIEFNFDGILDDFKKAASKLPEMAKPMGDDLAEHLAKRQESINAREQKFRDGLGKGYQSSDIKSAPVQVATASKIDLGNKELATKGVIKAQTELEKFAERFKTKVRTPLEEYGDTMKKAKEAFDKGLITEEEFRRASETAKHDAGIDKDDRKVAGAVELGSSEAYSTLVELMHGRTETQATQLAAQQLKAQQEGNKALGGIKKAVERANTPPQVASVF